MKKIVFVTGTRADYGKIKSLIKATDESKLFSTYVYITGMHLLNECGNTYMQVVNDEHGKCYVERNVQVSPYMDENLGNTILAFSRFVRDIEPDYIVVHGDRTDALAGASVGLLNNIKVVHIEGGELTGTVDDSIRHAITKMAHIHMTANEETKLRLIQLGEREDTINVIGSPDIDIMLSDAIPKPKDILNKYGIPFEKYGLFIYHPVVTEVESLDAKMKELEKVFDKLSMGMIVIHPNNDLGREVIVEMIEKLSGKDNIRVYKSFPFEEFLSLLKGADFIMGNSSAGIREACVYGIPCINIGTRQNGRYNARILKNIVSVKEDAEEILSAIEHTDDYRFTSNYYGNGRSVKAFMDAMKREVKKSDADVQKVFVDTDETTKKIERFINEGCE